MDELHGRSVSGDFSRGGEHVIDMAPFLATESPHNHSDEVGEDARDPKSAEARVDAFMEDDEKIADLLPEGKMGKIRGFFFKHKKTSIFVGGALLAGSALAFVAAPVVLVGGVVGTFAVCFMVPPMAPVGLVLGVVAVGMVSMLAGMGGAAASAGAGVGLGALSLGFFNAVGTSRSMKKLQADLKQAGVPEEAVKVAKKHLKKTQFFRGMDEMRSNKRWGSDYVDASRVRADMAMRIKHDQDLDDASKKELLTALVVIREQKLGVTVDELEKELTVARQWTDIGADSEDSEVIQALLPQEERDAYLDALSAAQTSGEKLDCAYEALKKSPYLRGANFSELDASPLKARRLEQIINKGRAQKESDTRNAVLRLAPEQLDAILAM